VWEEQGASRSGGAMSRRRPCLPPAGSEIARRPVFCRGGIATGLIAIICCVAVCLLAGCGQVSAVVARTADVPASKARALVADGRAARLKVEAARLVKRLDGQRASSRPRRLSAKALRVLAHRHTLRRVQAPAAVSGCVRVLEGRLTRRGSGVPAGARLRPLPKFALPGQVKRLVKKCLTDPGSVKQPTHVGGSQDRVS
jgi:hypothetical protein